MRNVKKTTANNLAERCARFVVHVLENDSKLACQSFDDMLDTLINEDYFGTEGQCDPRGDRR